MTGARWLVAGLVALAIVVAWQTPAVAAGEAKIPIPKKQKPISSKELQSFANAAREVFLIRQAFAPKVQSAKSEIDARDHIVSAQKKMEEAIRREGMTVARYNEILKAAQRDASLAGRIQALLDKAAVGK